MKTSPQNTSPLTADPLPLLVLYKTVENNTEEARDYALPEYGSGTILKIEVLKEELFWAQTIRIRHVPIATRILLTNSLTGDKEEGGAWVELETTRSNASLEKIGLDKISTYLGYLTNRGLDSDAPSRGFRVVDRGRAVIPGDLVIILVTTSAELK